MDLPRTPSLRVDGKRALVTGGTRGIGLAAAVALADAGAAVTIVARNAGDVVAVVAARWGAGHEADGKALDVTDFDAVHACVDHGEPFDVLGNSVAPTLMSITARKSRGVASRAGAWRAEPALVTRTSNGSA